MKRQFKFLLFAVLMLTLVMMTMICASAAANGDTEATEGFDIANYNFKVEDKDGNIIPFNVAVNDKVLITKYGGTEVTYNGTTYTILSENDILAVID